MDYPMLCKELGTLVLGIETFSRGKRTMLKDTTIQQLVFLIDWLEKGTQQMVLLMMLLERLILLLGLRTSWRGRVM